jgi:hypothetical protein
MAIFIDIEELERIFNTSYYNSTLRGPEIARIIRIRFGQQEQKSAVNARNSKGSGFIQDGLPED